MASRCNNTLAMGGQLNLEKGKQEPLPRKETPFHHPLNYLVPYCMR